MLSKKPGPCPLYIMNILIIITQKFNTPFTLQNFYSLCYKALNSPLST